MKIKICRLGRFNHHIDWQKIEHWKSKYFSISGASTIADIDVDHFTDGYVYPTRNITTDMGPAGKGVNLLVAIVDQPLEGNFYMHRIDNHRAVISIFPVLEILQRANIPVENYLLRCIYEGVVFLYEGKGVVTASAYQLSHHETRGCIFDMNVFIERVVYSCSRPRICEECVSKLRKKSLPDNFIEGISKELKRIKVPLFYRIEDWVKQKPILSLILATVFGIVLNIVASFIYDAFKRGSPN